jgi:hypothetical protein
VRRMAVVGSRGSLESARPVGADRRAPGGTLPFAVPQRLGWTEWHDQFRVRGWRLDGARLGSERPGQCHGLGDPSRKMQESCKKTVLFMLHHCVMMGKVMSKEGRNPSWKLLGRQFWFKARAQGPSRSQPGPFHKEV